MKTKSPSESKRSEPAWDIARLFPDQGCWDEEDYFGLRTNHFVELNDGWVDVLPLPTMSHQLILQRLLLALWRHAELSSAGEVVHGPLPVRLWRGTFYQPDLLFMLQEHHDRAGDNYWEGADLVMEVVSGNDEDRDRDLVKKREDYAAAGIPEYWIVDPREERVTVLRLQGRRYVAAAKCGAGEQAASVLLKGFSVSVSEVFAAARKR